MLSCPHIIGLMVTVTLKYRMGPTDNSLEDPGEEFKTHSVGQSACHHWHNDKPVLGMTMATLCVNGRTFNAGYSFISSVSTSTE